jgi:hypothetical protein
MAKPLTYDPANITINLPQQWLNLQCTWHLVILQFCKQFPVKTLHIVIWCLWCKRGRGASVGIATRYELNGQGIESQWGVSFSLPIQRGAGTHSASYAMGTGSIPGVKWSGRGVDHPTPTSAKVKERVKLWIYSTSVHSWPVLGWPLPFLNKLR